ncbi:hypothetical protein Dimus_014228 [Dionaea muscipula]
MPLSPFPPSPPSPHPTSFPPAMLPSFLRSDIPLTPCEWDDDLHFPSPFDQFLDPLPSPNLLFIPGSVEPEKELSPGTSDSGSIQSRYITGSDSGSDSPNQNPFATLGSDSFGLDQNHAKLEPGSGGSVEIFVSLMDERKQRRKESNRESAKRSRIRKQQQLESLRKELNRLESVSREKSNQLELAIRHCHRVLKENHRLRAESVMLRRRLTEMSRLLELRRLLHGHSAPVSRQ